MTSDNKNEPLFVPGEEVMVTGFDEAGYNTSSAIVTEVFFIPKYKPHVWFYNTSHMKKGYVFSEPCLVKLPKNSKTTWQQCLWRPEDD